MKQAIVLEHVVIEVQSSFNDFTFHLEAVKLIKKADEVNGSSQM